MKPKQNKVSLKLLLSFLAPSKFLMIIAIIVALIGTVPTILGPKIIEEITHRFEAIIVHIVGGTNADSSYSRFVEMGVIAVIIFIAGFILSTVSSLIMNEVTQKTTQRLRRSINIKINKVPISYFDKQSVGDVLSRATNDVDNLAGN